MRFFDLHCDTLGECFNGKKELRNNDLHIDLERGASDEKRVQVFAIWIPDELRKKAAVSYFDSAADYFDAQAEKNRDILMPFFGSEARERLYPLADRKKLSYILSVEGGAALGGKIEGLYHIYERGAKILTLTWNASNELAAGAYESEGGLTAFGKDVIKEADSLGITVDVSHLNRQSFFDVASTAQKPFIASHSNIDIVATDESAHRNLTKEQAEIIRDIGGLIGLNFYEKFLEDEKYKGFDALERQIDAFLEIGCENNLAIGSDYDGCTVPDGFGGIEKIPHIFDVLLKRGYPENLLNKIFFDNAYRFFSQNY